MAKKINAKLKRAYFYFGFNGVVSYQKVINHIDVLKNYADDEVSMAKIRGYAIEIEEFFDANGNRNNEEFFVEFAKEEPRKSWEHYTDDFPEDIFDDLIEPIEKVAIFFEDDEEYSIVFEEKQNPEIPEQGD